MQCFQLILNQPLHPALRQQFVNQGKNNIGATPPHSCHGLSAEIQSCRRPLALLSATMSDHLGKAQHASPGRALWWCRCGTFWLWMRCSVSLYHSCFPVTGTTQQCIRFFGTFPFNLHCVTVTETSVNPSLSNLCFTSAMFKIPV